jgi:hypothetical protein
MIINLLLIVMIALRLWTALMLFLAGRQNRLTSLSWLAGSFVLFAFAVAFAPTAGNPLGSLPASLWMYLVLGILMLFATIQFVAETFYQNRKSLTAWIWSFAVVMSGITLYGAALSTSNVQQHPLVGAFQVFLCMIFAWQGWAGYQAWRGVASEKMVEDWVKGRYQLVVGYSLCQFIASLCSMARVLVAGGSTGTALGGILAIVSLLTNTGMVVLAYLAWAAPQGFYRWLNRNYRSVEMKEVNEEEVMRQMMVR